MYHYDLRQPLNLINGYCQMIDQLCGDKLDGECLEFLHKAYEGTLRMNRLVTVLLQFSEAAHGDLKKEKVDLTATAEDVAAELRRVEPARNVTLKIAAGIVVEKDPNLLRVVVANLYAWKYTSPRAEAVIEFGVAEVEGSPVFFVRDNGVGFDMAQAGNLFVPFRRLPSG